jgi:hypothetical protein
METLEMTNGKCFSSCMGTQCLRTAPHEPPSLDWFASLMTQSYENALQGTLNILCLISSAWMETRFLAYKLPSSHCFALKSFAQGRSPSEEMSLMLFLGDSSPLAGGRPRFHLARALRCSEAFVCGVSTLSQCKDCGFGWSVDNFEG